MKHKPLPPANRWYRTLALPKSGRVPRTDRQRRKLDEASEAAADRERVHERQGGWCFARFVSPECTLAMMDPHELIPVSLGGKRESWCRVGLCRSCHREAQGRVGGLRLIFDWPGKDDGAAPNADVKGNVTCYWRRS